MFIPTVYKIKLKLRGDSRCFNWKLREENNRELRSSVLLPISPTLEDWNERLSRNVGT